MFLIRRDATYEMVNMNADISDLIHQFRQYFSNGFTNYSQYKSNRSPGSVFSEKHCCARGKSYPTSFNYMEVSVQTYTSIATTEFQVQNADSSTGQICKCRREALMMFRRISYPSQKTSFGDQVKNNRFQFRITIKHSDPELFFCKK